MQSKCFFKRQNSFLKGNREGVALGETGRSGKRGNCSLDVIYKRKLNKKRNQKQ